MTSQLQTPAVLLFIVITCSICSHATTSVTPSFAPPYVTSIRLWQPADFPDPQTSPELCGRSRPSFICDPSSALPASRAIHLDTLIRTNFNKSRCTNCTNPPFTLGVAVLPHTTLPHGVGGVKRELGELQQWADKLRALWAEKRNSTQIVIVVDASTNLVAVSFGPDAAEELNACRDRILINGEEYFIIRNYITGLATVVYQFKEVLRGERRYCVSNPLLERHNPLWALIGCAISITALAAVAACVCCYCCCPPNKKDRGQSINNPHVLRHRRYAPVDVMLSLSDTAPMGNGIGIPSGNRRDSTEELRPQNGRSKKQVKKISTGSMTSGASFY